MTVEKEKVVLLSEKVRSEIDRWIAQYPGDRKQSAVLTALTLAQEDNGGWLTNDVMDAVAEYLDMPPISVYEVATFYSMLDLEPVGRHKISVCNNISCMLCGSENIITHIENRYGVKVGGTSSDGKFTLKQEEECLAACGGGPMMTVDGRYYENLTPDKVDAILDGLE